MNKKKLTGLLAIAAAGLMMVGSLAYFTDTATENATAKAGTLDLVWTEGNDALWTEGIANFNPGDTMDLSYTIENTGNKSMDVQQTLTVTSSVAMTDSAEEYALTIEDEAGAVVITPSFDAEHKVATYVIPEIILDGTGANAEVETGSKGISENYTVTLKFADAAQNAFQDSDVTVQYDAKALQHKNTQGIADWGTISFETK